MRLLHAAGERDVDEGEEQRQKQWEQLLLQNLLLGETRESYLDVNLIVAAV